MFEAKSGLPWRFPHSVCRWPLHYMPVFWLCLWPTSLSENVHKQLLRVGTDLSVLTEILSCKCNTWRFQEWTTRCLPGQLVPFAATTAIKMSCGTFHHAIRPSRCLPGQLIPLASAYLCTECLCISLHFLPVLTFALSACAYLCTFRQCIPLHWVPVHTFALFASAYLCTTCQCIFCTTGKCIFALPASAYFCTSLCKVICQLKIIPCKALSNPKSLYEIKFWIATVRPKPRAKRKPPAWFQICLRAEWVFQDGAGQDVLQQQVVL